MLRPRLSVVSRIGRTLATAVRSGAMNNREAVVFGTCGGTKDHRLSVDQFARGGPVGVPPYNRGWWKSRQRTTPIKPSKNSILDRSEGPSAVSQRGTMRVLVSLVLLLAGLTAAAATTVQQVHPEKATIAETVETMRPGEYVWEPQVAPKGPLLLIVNIKSQRAVLFRNGVPIASSTISTGRRGYETPTGIFTVLQKKVEHYSSTYDNAPMPYMQRLTWRGVALHAGSLPGYPASHGCIRLPKGFAKLLYGTTTVGMTVVVMDRSAIPRIAPTPEVALRAVPGGKVAGAIHWTPERSLSGPVSIVVSTADQRAVVLRNGIEIGSAPVTMEPPVEGSWVYMLKRTDSSGLRHWIRIDLSEGDPSSGVGPQEWTRFRAPDAFRRAVAGIVTSGTTVIVTSDSVGSGSRGAKVTVLDDSIEPPGR